MVIITLYLPRSRAACSRSAVRFVTRRGVDNVSSTPSVTHGRGRTLRLHGLHTSEFPVVRMDPCSPYAYSHLILRKTESCHGRTPRHTSRFPVIQMNPFYRIGRNLGRTYVTPPRWPYSSPTRPPLFRLHAAVYTTHNIYRAR